MYSEDEDDETAISSPTIQKDFCDLSSMQSKIMVEEVTAPISIRDSGVEVTTYSIEEPCDEEVVSNSEVQPSENTVGSLQVVSDTEEECQDYNESDEPASIQSPQVSSPSSPRHSVATRVYQESVVEDYSPHRTMVTPSLMHDFEEMEAISATRESREKLMD